MEIDLTNAHPCQDCRQCLTNADKCRYCSERDQLRAEVARLRGELQCALTASGANAKAWQDCVEESAIKRTHLMAEIGLTEQRAEAAESHVALLRGVLEEVGSRITGLATVAWNAGQNPKGPWAEREREDRVSLAKYISAALATTPAGAGNRVKAAALKDAINKFPNIEGGELWQTSFMAWVLHEADRLEANNG